MYNTATSFNHGVSFVMFYQVAKRVEFLASPNVVFIVLKK